MENKIVITFDGTKSRRNKCRFIRGKLYEVNRQCFKVNNRFHRINNGKITLDYEKDKYVLKGSNNLIYGVVGKQNNGNPKYGYFSNNIIKNVRLEPNLLDPEGCISEKVANSLGYKEVMSTGYFINVDQFTGDSKKDIIEYIKSKKTQSRDFYQFPIHYGAAPMIRTFNEYFKQFNPVFTNIPKELSYQIKRFTFGIEYETSRGTIPERLLYKNGLIACRDGSIGGFEYVTVPMSGLKGLQAIHNHCQLLKRYCIIDNMCSLHIHLGGYPINKESIVALYRLLVFIQNEIYSMFPYHYKDTSYFKRMNYCGSLRGISMTGGIEEAFNKVYEFLTAGRSVFSGFNQKEHPMDNSGEHKWQISPRYKWSSLIPLIFGNRGTVEFRIHTPTSNSDKVTNWLFIVAAILSYAIDNKENLLKPRMPRNVNLTNIIKNIYGSSNLTKPLVEYINYRKSKFVNEFDSIGEIEIANDSDMLPESVKIL